MNGASTYLHQCISLQHCASACTIIAVLNINRRSDKYTHVLSMPAIEGQINADMRNNVMIMPQLD